MGRAVFSTSPRKGSRTPPGGEGGIFSPGHEQGVNYRGDLQSSFMQQQMLRPLPCPYPITVLRASPPCPLPPSPALPLHRRPQCPTACPRCPVPLGQLQHRLGEVQQGLEFGQAQARMGRGTAGQELGPAPLSNV